MDLRDLAMERGGSVTGMDTVVALEVLLVSLEERKVELQLITSLLSG